MQASSVKRRVLSASLFGRLVLLALGALSLGGCGAFVAGESCVQGRSSGYVLDRNQIENSGDITITYIRSLCDYGRDFNEAKKSLKVNLNGSPAVNVDLSNATLSGTLSVDAARLNLPNGRTIIPITVNIDVQPASYNLTRTVPPEDPKDRTLIVEFNPN